MTLKSFSNIPTDAMKDITNKCPGVCKSKRHAQISLHKVFPVHKKRKLHKLSNIESSTENSNEPTERKLSKQEPTSQSSQQCKRETSRKFRELSKVVSSTVNSNAPTNYKVSKQFPTSKSLHQYKGGKKLTPKYVPNCEIDDIISTPSINFEFLTTPDGEMLCRSEEANILVESAKGAEELDEEEPLRQLPTLKSLEMKAKELKMSLKYGKKMPCKYPPKCKIDYIVSPVMNIELLSISDVETPCNSEEENLLAVCAEEPETLSEEEPLNKLSALQLLDEKAEELKLPINYGGKKMPFQSLPKCQIDDIESSPVMNIELLSTPDVEMQCSSEDTYLLLESAGEEEESSDKELLEQLSTLQSLRKKAQELKISIQYEKLKKEEPKISNIFEIKRLISELKNTKQEKQEDLKLKQLNYSRTLMADVLYDSFKVNKKCEVSEYSNTERLILNLLSRKKQINRELSEKQQGIVDIEEKCQKLKTNIHNATLVAEDSSDDEDFKLKIEHQKRNSRVQLISKIIKCLIENISPGHNITEDVKVLAASCDDILNWRCDNIDEMEEICRRVCSTDIKQVHKKRKSRK